MTIFAISLACDDDDSCQLFECEDFHAAVELGLDVAREVGSRLRGISAAVDVPMLNQTPQVGIFWLVQSADDDKKLIVDCLPMAKAETYGDFLTHGAHYQFWSKLATMSSFELEERFIPDVVRWTEYEEWPRGRIVCHQPSGRFILYADQNLQTPGIIEDIMRQFSVPADHTDVRSDSHYVSTRR